MEGEQPRTNSQILRHYSDLTGEETVSEHHDLQLPRHNLLLLLLSISMFGSAALCTWRNCREQASGSHIEMEVLDRFLNLCQSILTCAMFGIDAGQIVKLGRALVERLFARRGADQAKLSSVPPTVGCLNASALPS